ncbi:uncharacterized protein [Primulina huaijiensis]|uniref:uncharacterized protein n=1 Tax=Primulina huaijiensis TaxID=1492673 RepID=UPI003CC6F3E2
MDSLAFNDAVNQLEVSCGVHIPADSRAVAQKNFQVYGEDLSVAEGALGLLRHASIKLVRKEYNTLEEKWKKFVQKWLPSSVKSFCEIDDRAGLLSQLGPMVVALTPKERESVDNKDHISSEASRIHTIIDQLRRTFHVDYWQKFVVSPNMIVELNLTPEGAKTLFFCTSIGLDHIISFIVETISKKKPSRCPLGSFLLVGCRGRGRTELARALAKQLFDHEDLLVLCDMSDYHDANSGPRFRDDLCGDALLGKLVDISKKKAYGILIFANIEKASPSVLEMIVSILHEGIFKNREGMLFDLTAVLVLMKPNAGNDVFLRP